MIRLNKVTKTYGAGRIPAVASLDLEVKRGEIYGFLGPNGAGKSTTINMIVGKIQQDSGSILVNGIDNRISPVGIKRIIGYVPDEPVYYEKMTGLRYLNFIGDLFEVSGDVRKKNIERYANIFNLTKALQDKISSYSHGMKQKLGIIAALMHEPSVLILDEPMVGLDPKSSFLLKDVMREFCNEGKTVFFSTHVMDVAERLCDRVGIINKGKLVFSGSFAELKQQKGEDRATLEQLFLELTDSEASATDEEEA